MADIKESAANFDYEKEMAALKKTHCLTCYQCKADCVCNKGVKLTTNKNNKNDR